MPSYARHLFVTNYVRVENISKVRRYPVEPGDVVVLETGGGGWGDPQERSIEFIERDLRRGYISKESAERDYGVRVIGDRVERR